MKRPSHDTLLGTQRMGPLLARMSIPAGFAMLVGATYNLVDAIFVGRGVGADGIAALALAFPVQMLFTAVAGMLGFGAASVVSRSLGAGNRERAAQAAGSALGLSAAVGVLASAAGLVALRPLLVLLGASAALLPITGEYVSIILLGVTVITVATTANNLIRSEGHAQFAMLSMVAGMALNIGLDPVFIFALNMGVRGAALATVIAQSVTLILVLYFFTSGRSALTLAPKHLLPRPRVTGEILALGAPALVRQGGMSLLMVVINNSLGFYGGDLYIAAYGASVRLMIFMVMPVFGVAQGFQPIAGYNYGAGQYDRVRQVVKASIVVTVALNGASFLVMMLFSHQLLRMFTGDAELLSISAQMLRIFILIIPVIGVQFIGSSLFQAIGKALPALLLGLSRQFLLLIPLALVLPRFFGVMGVIAAFPVADLLSTVITAWLMIAELRRMGRGAQEPAAAAPRRAAGATPAAGDEPPAGAAAASSR